MQSVQEHLMWGNPYLGPYPMRSDTATTISLQGKERLSMVVAEIKGVKRRKPTRLPCVLAQQAASQVARQLVWSLCSQRPHDQNVLPRCAQ